MWDKALCVSLALSLCGSTFAFVPPEPRVNSKGFRSNAWQHTVVRPSRPVFMAVQSNASQEGGDFPATLDDAIQQAALATQGALQMRQSRVQVNMVLEEFVPGPPSRRRSGIFGLCNALIDMLHQDNTGLVHIFFNSLSTASEARKHIKEHLNVKLNVIGLGDVVKEDDAIILVNPSNRGSVLDAAKLEAVLCLIARANKRPTILINPDLQAIVHWQPTHIVRPTFMRDFEYVYFLVPFRPLPVTAIEAKTPENLALFRVFPHDWRIYQNQPRREAKGQSQGHGYQLVSSSPTKPDIEAPQQEMQWLRMPEITDS